MMHVLARHDPQDAGQRVGSRVPDFTAGLGRGLTGSAGRRCAAFLRDRSSDRSRNDRGAGDQRRRVARHGRDRRRCQIVAVRRLMPTCGSLISRSESYAIHQHWLRTRRNCMARSAVTA